MKRLMLDADGMTFDAARIGGFTDVVTNAESLLRFRKTDGSLSDRPPVADTPSGSWELSSLLVAEFGILDNDGKLMRRIIYDVLLPQQVVKTFEDYRQQALLAPRAVRAGLKQRLIDRAAGIPNQPEVKALLEELLHAAEEERLVMVMNHELAPDEALPA